MHNIIHATLREQVADAIRVKIIKHELEPGQRIIESDIAQTFGVSHGPVREALRQLEQEGIVEYTRNAGCSVRNLDIVEIIEVLMIRCIIEYSSVKAIQGNLSEEALSDFAEVLDMMKRSASITDSDPEEIDAEFHRILILNSNMPHLIKLWDSYEYVMLFTFSNVVDYDEYMALQFYNNHKVIYDAFATRDCDMICKAIYDHYISNITKMLASNNMTEDNLSFSLDIIKPCYSK